MIDKKSAAAFSQWLVENIFTYAETELGGEIRMCPECFEAVRWVGGDRWRHLVDCNLGKIDNFLTEKESE